MNHITLFFGVLAVLASCDLTHGGARFFTLPSAGAGTQWTTLGCMAFGIGCPSGNAGSGFPTFPAPGAGAGTLPAGPAGAVGSRPFVDGTIAQTNTLRKRHCAAPLTEDPALTAAAQAYANRLASGAPWAHSPAAQAGQYGENLMQQQGGSVQPATAVNAWYGENRFYDYNNPTINTSGPSMNGHFTALVWKGTTRVGVGSATSASGVTFVVCNYSPPGNYADRASLDANVSRPSC